MIVARLFDLGLARCELFIGVVHPVLTEEAGVARLQRFSGGPDERAQECPVHAARSRADEPTRLRAGRRRRPSLWKTAGARSRTVRKCADRYRREGSAGRRIAPPGCIGCDCRRPRRWFHEIEVATPPALDRQADRAAETGVPPATVSRVLRRLGLNKLTALEPLEPIQRYEREKPGEPGPPRYQKARPHRLRLDIAVTGRYPGAVNRHHGIGWEFVHVCIDDASRVVFVQVLADQRVESAVAYPAGRRRLFTPR